MSENVKHFRKVRKDSFVDAISYKPNTGKGSKKDYNKPSLQNYGDIRDVTLGGSVNPGDSGGGLLPF